MSSLKALGSLSSTLFLTRQVGQKTKAKKFTVVFLVGNPGKNMGPGQGWSLSLVFFLASKAPPWTRRPRLRLGLKTFKLFLDEIPIVFLEPPLKKN